MVSKCGKNKKVANKAKLSLFLVFLVHFDVICDLSLNRHAVTWNLFVLHDKKSFDNGEVIYASAF